jgi:hypothetical protein
LHRHDFLGVNHALGTNIINLHDVRQRTAREAGVELLDSRIIVGLLHRLDIIGRLAAVIFIDHLLYHVPQ